MLAKRLMSSRGSRPSSGDPGVASNVSILLRIPLDSVLDIIRFLHRRDRALFSLTCSNMRNAVKLLSHSNHAEDKDKKTYINYLYCLGRDMPYHWVCEPCMKLHRLSTKDTPHDTSQSHCRKIQCWFLHSQCVHRAQHFQLGHRHVQLAVKLSRLGNNLLKEQRLYFEAIMAPYTGIVSFPTDPSDTVARPAKHTVRCKIVNDRFLTLTTFVYSSSRRCALSMEALGAVTVCEHQSPYTQDQTSFVPLSEPMTLTSALQMALKSPKFPVVGHCPHCPVDFEVSWKGKMLRVRTWADFGTDECAKEGSWDAVVRDSRDQTKHSYYDRCAPPPKYPEKGLVRARYEAADQG